ncbi:MAG: O-antigen ligase family protein [Candidatus Binatia bacterium]
MVLFICLAAFTVASYGPINIRVYQAFAVCGLLALLNPAARRIPPTRHSRYALTIGFIFLAWCFLSMVAAKYPLVTVKQAMLLMMYILVCYLAYRAFDSPKSLAVYFAALWVGSLIAYVYGYLQALLPTTVGALAFRDQQLSAGVISQLEFYRPMSFFSEGNEFGQFIIFSASMFIACSLYARRRWIKWCSVLALVVALPILLVNASRGTLLALLVVGLLVLRVNRKQGTGSIRMGKALGTLALFVALGTAGITYLVLPNIPTFGSLSNSSALEWAVGRILNTGSESDRTLFGRLQQAWVGARVSLENPVIGVGYGNVFTVLDQVYLEQTHVNAEDSGIPGIPNTGNATTANFVVDIAAETGLVGLAIFLLMLVQVARIARSNLAAHTGSAELAFSLGSYLAFWGILVNSLSYSGVGLVTFWLNVGVILGMSDVARSPDFTNVSVG